MDPEFWHRRWADNQIAFHEASGNPLLRKHIDVLGLAPGARVFVPLCGKTRDIGWLLAEGYRVVGCELVESAIRQLFDELGAEPRITEAGLLTHYGADGLDILAGDVFDLTAEALGPVDAVFDRAALVALPGGMRARYARHMAAVTGRARQMLLTFEYDQSKMNGPPFSVTADEVAALYGDNYEVALTDRVTLKDGLKGKVAAMAAVWLLTAR